MRLRISIQAFEHPEESVCVPWFLDEELSAKTGIQQVYHSQSYEENTIWGIISISPIGDIFSKTKDYKNERLYFEKVI